MKNIKSYLGFVAIVALLFTSCSKEENGPINLDSEKATLSFGAILNDIATNRAVSKQSVGDLPICTDDVPAYVQIVLSQDGSAVLGTETTPFRVNLAPNQIFTVEVPELELTPGNYTLDYFSVYNAAEELIWLAPRGGVLADFVDNPLPLAIDLRAGVKKYVDVPVLCYDERDVIEYGYVFFDLDTNEAIKFCIFGNYCPPSGRHFPASYSVNVWYGTNATGAPLYTNVENTTGYYDNGDFYAEPLCFALPDREGEDNYYFEVTMLSNDEYGQVQEEVIRIGSITDGVVRSFFDGDRNMDYYHFRQGCEEGDTPPIFENPGDGADYYKACLLPENGSNAFGFAYMRLEGNVLQTTVLASGLEPNMEHMQHIHENATCDNPGPPILDLRNEDGSWPVASAVYGDVVYHRTFTLGSNGIPAATTLQPLENRNVNLHGMTVDGTYNAGIIVACGPVDKVNND